MQYIFKHILMRDAVYDMQLQRRLRELHRRAAAAYQTLYGDDLEPYYADLVYHYHHAGNLEQERRYAALAGKEEAKIGSHETAVDFFTRALELTPADDVEARYDLLMAREASLNLHGAREAQTADLEELAQLVGLSDPQAEVTHNDWAVAVTLRQAQYAEAVSDYEAAIEAAQRALRFTQAANDRIGEARARDVWGGALYRQGDYAAAQKQCQQGVKAALAAGSSPAALAALAQNWNGLGALSSDLGEQEEAHNYYKQSLAIFQEIGDQLGVSLCLNELGKVADILRDPDTARRYYEQSLHITKKVGYQRGTGTCLVNLGVLANDLGDQTAARAYYEQSLSLFREINDQQGVSICLNNLGNVSKHFADYAAAQTYYEQSIVVSEKIGDLLGVSICFNELGDLALLQANPNGAVNYYMKALDIHKKVNLPYYLVEDYAGLAQAALVLEDKAKALSYAERVVVYLQENPSLDGAENPMRVFRFVWQVLAALADARAEDVLTVAARAIQERADNIPDPAQRQMYLDQPHHRLLWAGWMARSATSHK